MIEKIVLGFGSNMGSRLNNIQSALKEISLTEGFNLIASSSVYETEPWGFKRQHKFLNSCSVFLCRLSPGEVLKTIKSAEKRIGRIQRGKWQAREIDIDLLF
jgi:2-amino-4-hydroxy-6-hydroxymethyldihydropteridine diphosphokinase